MASNYTDNFDAYSIKSGSPLSAQGMVGALNTKEKVANKVSAAEWAANEDSDTKYPSCKAAQSMAEAAVDNSAVVEKVANKVSSTGWSANKTSDTKYPTCAAAQSAIDTAVAKVTSITSSSTDSQFPSAKAVYDLLWNKFNDF